MTWPVLRNRTDNARVPQMFHAASPRVPLPPAQSSAPGGPSPRSPLAQQKPKPQGKQRDAFFDNAKYLAIVLVAVGHAWEPLREGSRTVTALYTLVYAVHMPAFIVVSGYFSRGFDGSPQRVRRLITGVAVPYVVFEVAYTLFTRWTDDAPD